MYLPNTSTPSRMWHKANFYANYCWFELRVFLLLDSFQHKAEEQIMESLN